MRQRLGLADVLIKNPEVIILDEPTLGIDPTGVREFLELIVKLSKKESITVLLSSHLLYQVQQVCDRVGLFVSGKLLAEGDIQTLSQKLFTKSLYIIEADVSVAEKNKSYNRGRSDTTAGLINKLQDINGVVAVYKKNNIFHIECSHDVTPEVAKVIVKSGIDLNCLNKKEYGLDDIYYRYFEGGLNHE
jgi:ABC-2 type transport system ATP-binding protein